MMASAPPLSQLFRIPPGLLRCVKSALEVSDRTIAHNVPVASPAGEKAEENDMSFDKKDVKQGVDEVATHLKQAIDKVAETSDMIASKAKEAGRKTGDKMIQQGKRLKSASR
jgi:hypothetical protein